MHARTHARISTAREHTRACRAARAPKRRHHGHPHGRARHGQRTAMARPFHSHGSSRVGENDLGRIALPRREPCARRRGERSSGAADQTSMPRRASHGSALTMARSGPWPSMARGVRPIVGRERDSVAAPRASPRRGAGAAQPSQPREPREHSSRRTAPPQAAATPTPAAEAPNCRLFAHHQTHHDTARP